MITSIFVISKSASPTTAWQSSYSVSDQSLCIHRSMLKIFTAFLTSPCPSSNPKPNSADSPVIDASRKTPSAFCFFTFILNCTFFFHICFYPPASAAAEATILIFSSALYFIHFLLPMHFVTPVMPSSLPLSLESLPVSQLLLLSP